MNWTAKYRPRQIEHLTLKSVRSTVLKWLEKGWIPQTLLFTGPKGTGKTTTARLLAATLNDPRNQKAVLSAYQGHQLNKSKFLSPKAEDDLTDQILRGHSYAVLEIDAASHRGIDDIRQLRDQLQLSPTTGAMMVCILDEAHMLTKEAWNALLKTLEEPPDHVIFVLATTELHKVPATIQSRCQILQFSQPTIDELVMTLQRVAKQEKIDINTEQLMSTARQADGSVRDAIKHLERLVTEGRVNQDHEDLVQLTQDLQQFIRLIIDKEPAKFSELCQQLRAKATDERFFQTQLLTTLHHDLKLHLLHKSTQFEQLSQAAVAFLLNEFIDADLSAQSLIPFLKLELRGLSIIARATKNQQSGNQTKSANRRAEPASGAKNPKLGAGSEFALVSENLNSTKTNNNSNQLSKEVISALPNHDTINQSSLEQLENASTEVTDSIISVTNFSKTVDPSLAFNDNHQSSHPLRIDDAVNNVEPIDSSAAERLLADWQNFTEAISAYNQTLAAIIRSAQPKILSHSSVQLNLNHQFHVEIIGAPKTRQVLEQTAQVICQSPVTLEAQAVVPVRATSIQESKSIDLVTLATQALT